MVPLLCIFYLRAARQNFFLSAERKQLEKGPSLQLKERLTGRTSTKLQRRSISFLRFLHRSTDVGILYFCTVRVVYSKKKNLRTEDGDAYENQQLISVAVDVSYIVDMTHYYYSVKTGLKAERLKFPEC